MHWYFDVLKKYVAFEGRARRKEYWMFVLFSVIISIAIGIVDRVAGLTYGNGNGVLGTIYSLAILLPSLGVIVRRLHDTNRSGWWYLLVFTCIGIPVVLYFFILEGDKGSNQYGPDPKKGERTALGDDDYDDRPARRRDDREDFDDDTDDRPARRPTR